MTKKNKKIEFLPLGTVIQYDEGKENKYLIAARKVEKEKDGRYYPVYQVIKHPESSVKLNPKSSVKYDQITNVLFAGYSDEADFDFLETLIEELSKKPEEDKADSASPEDVEQGMLEMFSKPSTRKPSDKANNQKEKQEISENKNDPFHLFRKKKIREPHTRKEKKNEKEEENAPACR